MNKRILRGLIVFFIVVICVSLLILAVAFIGVRVRGRGSAKEAPDEPLFYSSKKQRDIKSGLTPPPGGAPSSGTLHSEGAIMIIREKEFKGVGEKPKSLMAALNEMAGGGKKSPPAVALNEADLDRKLNSPSFERGRKLAASGMPQLGAADAGAGLVTAPVDFKLFKSAEVWQAFAVSRRVAGVKHDFSAADLLILVSLSDLPDGIFRITAVERTAKATVVKYRVDPDALDGAAEDREEGVGNYAWTAIPKKAPPVKLEQVP